MPTYKNIRIKMKNGKSRLQRVQVLASGKYKFVKNTGKTKKSSKKTKKARKGVRRMAKKKNYKSKAKAILGKYGMVGMVEDLAWGYLGTQAVMGMGYPLDSALPMTRIIQGAVGKALKRRGAGRLEYGVLDLIDVYLIKKGFNLQGISLRAFQ